MGKSSGLRSVRTEPSRGDVSTSRQSFLPGPKLEDPKCGKVVRNTLDLAQGAGAILSHHI